MNSFRLEEKRVEIDGKTYTLRCNMAVIDALQQAHNGNFGEVLELPMLKGMVEILAAMLNDSAEDEGWEADWTPRKVEKRFSYAELQNLDIMGMFTRAVIPPEAKETATPDKENAGN